MRLIKARISSFRSIAETILHVDPNITVVVGANEGGKTNVLKALEAFNHDVELSESMVCQFSSAYSAGQFPEVQLLFGELSTADREAVARSYLLAATRPEEAGEAQEEQEEGEKEEKGDNEKKDDKEGEAKDGKDVVASESAPPRPVVESLPPFQRLTVTRQGNTPEEIFVHLDNEEVTFPDADQAASFKEEILKLLPRFLYFEDIDLLRGEIELSDLLNKESAFQTERNLLHLGGISDLNILTGPPHRRDVALKNAEERVTARLKRYWTQDQSRKFHVNVDKDTLRVRISDATGVFDFPENRSLGSRWFISFYINFASRIEAYPENAVLLFDEPGIHIHPRGQRDLLPFFEELGNKHQLIYSAHLPFLINRNFPGRIRVVQKEGAQGTIVNNKPHDNRWKAIRSAVGLLASDSFLIGDTCLVVEGVSDHIYMAGVSRFLAEMGLDCLDLNQVGIIPAASASETVAPVRFCQAEKIPVVVLLDSDNQGNQAAETLTRDGFISKRQVLSVNDAFPRRDEEPRTFEDLLPMAMLLEAISRFYRGRVDKFRTITGDDFRAAQAAEGGKKLPVANTLAMIFRSNGYGDLDKRAVAEEFVNGLPDPKVLRQPDLARLRKEFAPLARICRLVGETLAKLSGEVSA